MVEAKQGDFVVAVGLDGSDSSWKALGEAVYQAKSRKASLHIVSIQESVDASYNASEVLAADKTSREKLERIQTKARLMAEEQGVEAVMDITAGTPHGAILDYIKHHKVDLLVVGDTGHLSIWGSLLGNTADKIVRSAPCSVLVVRQ